jgi:hypothetical protein
MPHTTTPAAPLSRAVTTTSRRRLARITGGLYLAFILLLALADRLGHIGPGTTEQVHESLTGEPTQFAVGLTLGMLSAFTFVLAAWGLYVLLKPTNPELALLFLLLNAIGAAIQVASYFPLLLALLATDTTGFTTAFSAAQVEALQHLAIDVHKVGFASAQLFFGTWLFPLGYLVYRSGILPKFLGVLLLLDGVAVLLWFFQALLLPDYPGLVTPGLALSFVAEAGLGLWLLIVGIRVNETGERTTEV